ncbi:MAG: type II secretion system protein [Elusimicrobiaceae bacterium]|nr:type II secretion system protein [Elusimicrobiaceae bacterium]
MNLKKQFGYPAKRGPLSKAGFTLIELLVVVLIIGILSSVALPKYQVAVLKSKTVELQVNAKALHDAAKIVYLETGQYPTDFTQLSIEWAGTLKESGDGSGIEFSNGAKCNFDKTDDWVECQREGVRIIYTLDPNDSVKIMCASLKDDALAKKVCLSLGGEYYFTGAWGDFYKL